MLVEGSPCRQKGRVVSLLLSALRLGGGHLNPATNIFQNTWSLWHSMVLIRRSINCFSECILQHISEQSADAGENCGHMLCSISVCCQSKPIGSGRAGAQWFISAAVRRHHPTQQQGQAPLWFKTSKSFLWISCKIIHSRLVLYIQLLCCPYLSTFCVYLDDPLT